MAQVGFGAYRISHRSEAHQKALKLALDNGCPLIDTAYNYTNGDSETLIGEVLSKRKAKPIVITKTDEKEAITPDSIRNNLDQSLKRLQLSSVDALLLQNPENYFNQIGATQEECYQKIFIAFQTMEDLIKEGKIKSYGVSSNTFINPLERSDTISILKLLDIKQKFSFTGFKIIQFPLNLLELGALERQFEGRHLIEVAQENGLTTIANRPFNALSQDGLVRLATYEAYADLTDDPTKVFMEKISSLVQEFEKNKEDAEDRFFEIPLMKQFSEIWHKQSTPEAVEQVFHQYIFPFIAQIFGRNLSAKESEPFYDLYDLARAYARKNMHQRAVEFENKAIDMGLLRESDKSLTQKAIEKYSTLGVDYILCGMRESEYVEELKEFF